MKKNVWLKEKMLIDVLQFAENVTPHDITFGVNVLNRYLQNLGIVHQNSAKRALRYLKKTANEGIEY